MLTQHIIDAENTALKAFEALGSFASKHQQSDFYNAARILGEVRHAALMLQNHPEQREQITARLLEIFN